MFLKYLSAMFVVLIPAFSMAQQDSPKSTQNTSRSNIDYKRPGTKMPELIFLSYNDTSSNAQPDKKKKRPKRKKNQISISDTSGFSLLTGHDLRNDGNLLIMLFNPTCLHCEDMTFLIEKNIDLFRKTEIVLLASKAMIPYIPDFSERHHLSKYKQMYIGWDSSGFVDDLFLYQKLPQLNIFDKHRKLLKIYSGEVPIDSLKQFIN